MGKLDSAAVLPLGSGERQLPARAHLADDQDPNLFHVIYGSTPGIDCFKRIEHRLRDMDALHIACAVAGRAAASEKSRADALEAELRRECERSQASDRQALAWVAV